MSADAYERLHVIRNPDSTLTRLEEFYPTVPASLTSSPLSLSKDVPLNLNNHTSIRLFLPRLPPTGSDPPAAKLPILVYVHGGGFVLASVATPFFHDFCSTAASRLRALVVSVEYRLAPEHRLPAAYDDVLEALTWVRDGKDVWVTEYGDLSRCVIAGDSAGGNIVYHAGLMAAARIDDFQPLIIRGLILIQPYFSGLTRTGSELRLVDDSVLPLNNNDFLWELALPVGADRSHEFSDPNAGGGSCLLDRVRDLGWRVGVIGSDGDPLFDRNVELARLMEKRGLNVKSMFTKDDKHGDFVYPTSRRNDVIELIMEFLSQ